MPRPTKKRKTRENRLALRDLAAELERVKGEMHGLLVDLDGLWQRLYTVGLDERGPITERDDDIPF